MPYLCSLLAPWLREQGSREKLAEWLKVPDYMQDVKDAIAGGKWYIRLAYNPNSNPQWAENIWVVEHEKLDGEKKTLAKIAEEREKNPLDVYFDLVRGTRAVAVEGLCPTSRRHVARVGGHDDGVGAVVGTDEAEIAVCVRRRAVLQHVVVVVQLDGHARQPLLAVVR